MIQDCYDQSRPLIHIQDLFGESHHMVDKCLITFSQVLFSHLREQYPCTLLTEIPACNGLIPIYALEDQGETIAFYLSPIGSAIAGDTCYEVSWLTGAKKFVMFGSCGTLAQETTRGHFIVPTETYRGEGCSYYLKEPSDYLTVKNAEKVAELFTEMNVPFVQGRIWTTDSLFRETEGLVARRRSEGCIAVEMEVAGVQSYCDYYGMELYDFLECGDVLGETDYQPEGLNAANHNLAKLQLALELAHRI